MVHLQIGTFLQGGKYKIEKVLGQGGFGITYLATQELLDRKVCIKEFFIKEYCERDETTSIVSLGTQNSHEIVERFMNKFLKEARTISTLSHPHIIRIYDIFKENNTAYYVMEYIEGESLSDKVNRYGFLSESEALAYIKQIASALDCIHQRSINHLDVKPANIMIRKDDFQAVLIDFGLSKQYDAQGGQTSTTPVGISHGYAPMEQYNVGGVSVFSPQTDIYALGATLYKLLTGVTPPQAGEVLNDGLPELPVHLSENVKNAIKQSMQVRKKDRPEDVKAFLDLMDTSTSTLSNKENKVIQTQSKQGEDETTMVLNKPEKKEKTYSSRSVDDNSKSTISFEPEEKDGKKKRNYIPMFICMVIVFVGLIIFAISGLNKSELVMTQNADAIAKELEENRINDSIANVRRNEAEKRRNDSINAMNEKARLAALRKKEEENRKTTHGTINGHEYVDLGLSVKWATCNVGASKSSDYGNYYAWGESIIKEIYTTFNSVTYGKELKDISANNPVYDTAKTLWGSSWRIPTKEEMEELIEKCQWKLTTQDYHTGFKVVGPNGNSIFLPIAGRYSGKILEYKGLHSSYFSSSPYHSGDNTYAYVLKIGEKSATTGREYYIISWEYRSTGASIRPVTQ